MNKKLRLSIFIGFILITLISCNTKNKPHNKHERILKPKEGTFGYDKEFLQKHYKKTIILQDETGKSSLVISPELQGRVMTSTLNGDKGMSFGWINYELIRSGETKEHINPTGGEERFWIGPEGGQFSIYFKPQTNFVFDDWYVPKEIDTEEFNIVSQDARSAVFQKEMNLINYSGTRFNLEVNRKVSLLTKSDITKSLRLKSSGFSAVAYETVNSIKNIGAKTWSKESGLLSIWLLSMLNPSPQVTVVVPIKQGTTEKLGIKVNDNYFGKVSNDRLKVSDKTVFFKADGNSRGKIGFSPLRSTPYMGSYDASNKVLTILEIAKPKSSDKYVNSAWEIQEDPYSGDVLNSYNDGPLEDGSQMGPFYELESSSPALTLESNQSYEYKQRIYHIKGSRKVLDRIANKILQVSIDEIEAIF